MQGVMQGKMVTTLCTVLFLVGVGLMLGFGLTEANPVLSALGGLLSVLSTVGLFAARWALFPRHGTGGKTVTVLCTVMALFFVGFPLPLLTAGFILLVARFIGHITEYIT